MSVLCCLRTVAPLAFGALLVAPGCFQSELNGSDVGSLTRVDDTAFVRFHTEDDYWVGLIVMSNTGGDLYCPDFESSDWIELVMDEDTMIIQLYEEQDDEWVGAFGEDYDEDDVRFASGVIWTRDLVGGAGQDGKLAFTREEALDPCLGHRFTEENADTVVPYDHDVEVELNWWSEGIDLRGAFQGSAAAGWIRAVDCGPLAVPFEIGDRLAEYDRGC